ncbi:sugar ABC transporter permease [Pseudoclostridium thermosuccinogenes]|uniref:carbohydrate ABC transporter permease n=1 Tax=Clostridium thermosuccinogenes TaxID=84032 RepID=UPI002FDB8211
MGKKRRLRLGVTTRREMKGYLFILPWLVGFGIFFAYPMFQSFIYSISSVRITAKARIVKPVGFDNYMYIFTKDIYFVERLRAFFLNTIFSLPVILVFSLMIAMLINQKIKFKGFFRTLFFLPIIVVSGPVLERLISEGATTIPMIEQYGVYDIINEVVPYMLVEPISYLFSQLILILWYSGVPILIYLAGLQKIDINLYEAALIDGASSWVVFWKITLPSLKGIILINAIYTLVFLGTSEINEVIILIKNNMLNPNTGFGIASAMAWTFTVGLGLIMVIIYFIGGREKPAVVQKKRPAKKPEKKAKKILPVRG